MVIIQWWQDQSRGLFAWVKTPGFNWRLLSSWLDAVLDLTGSVDGELADEGEQGLGMRWIMEVLACLQGHHFYLSYAS